MVQETDHKRTDSQRSRSPGRWWLGAVAAVLVGGLVAGAWWLSRPDDAEVALDTADRFFEVMNAGDVDGLKTVLDAETADITVSVVEPPGEREVIISDSILARRDLVFWMGVGMTIEDIACESNEAGDGRIALVCEAQSIDTLRAAVGASMVGIETSFTVADGTVEDFDQLYILPEQGVVAGFLDWLQEAYPDDFAITTGPAVTDEDAFAAGRVRARHADEYAAHLEANGCPADGC